MESEEIYIAGIKEQARVLVETAVKDSLDYLKSLMKAPAHQEAGEKYEVEDITWIPCGDFTVERGKTQIEQYISTWELHESWLHCTDYMKEEELEFSKRYHYRMRWSIPSCRKPIPRATVCVYFTIQISKIKPPILPVEVFFFVESNRLVHRTGQTRFREKWLKDVIESKIILMDSVTF
ncbi:hypothetical protein FKM82_002531 [Ascaphus truei]